MSAEPPLVPDPAVPGAWLVRVGRTDQSWVDPEDPTRLEFDYLQRIADVIDLSRGEGTRPRVVHIGGAGMSLARWVSAVRPTSPQIVLEPDAALTEEVRRVLPLARTSGIKVRPVDGLAGIAAMREDFAEIVVLDAFAGARVPAELTTVEFFADVARVLTGDGLLIANVTDSGPFPYVRRVLAGVREIWPQVLLSAEPSTLKGRRFGNVIIAASAVALPVSGLTRRAAGSAFPYRVLSGSPLDDLVGGASAYRGEDRASSPAPPDTFFAR